MDRPSRAAAMGGAAQKTVKAGSDRAEGVAGEQMPRGVLLEWHPLSGCLVRMGGLRKKVAPGA